MINVKDLIVEELLTIGIPVNYELFTSSGIEVPSISYLELTNTNLLQGNTLEYDTINFQIKLWSSDAEYLSVTSITISEIMRDLGFTRTFAQEIPNNGLISKVMRFAAITTNHIT